MARGCGVVMRDGEAPEPSAHHGRSARAAGTAGLRPSPGADPASRPPRRARASCSRTPTATFPLCAPARFSMLSGRLPSRIGAFDNAVEFPASVPTFHHYLRLAGYRTCLAGQDALRRPRPAPRLRGAGHHRRLSGRLPVDAGLAARRRDLARVVPRHEQGARSRPAPAQHQRRLRRRGSSSRRCGGCTSTRTAGTTGRLRSPSRSSRPMIPISRRRAGGSGTTASRSTRRGLRISPLEERATRTAGGTGSSPAPPRDGRRVRRPAHAARLLRA